MQDNCAAIFQKLIIPFKITYVLVYMVVWVDILFQEISHIQFHVGQIISEGTLL